MKHETKFDLVDLGGLPVQILVQSLYKKCIIRIANGGRVVQPFLA